MKKKSNISGIELAYTVTGEGRDVILMHGWGCTHETVLSVERAVLPGFRVFNLDLPGCGDSSEPTSVWGVEDYDRMLEQLIAAEGIEQPILIGHSNGGRVAIQYASHHPVHKLILIDAAGIKPRRKPKYYIKVYSYKAMKHLAWLLMGKQRGEQWLERYRKRAGSADYNASSPRMRAIMSRLVNTDLKAVMPSIQCPTLLIWGEDDTATPLSDAKTMERLIPDAGLVSFPGCGHYSFLDNPGQFAAVMRSFLDKDRKLDTANEQN